MKTEAGSQIVEAQTLPELVAVIDGRFRYYNRRRHHSGIGYVPLSEYLANVLSLPEFTYPITSAA